MILLSNHAEQTKEGGQKLIGGLDVVVTRNAFGTQLDSFSGEVKLDFLSPNDPPFKAVFIRAPVVDKVPEGSSARIVGTIPAKQGQEKDLIVAVQQDCIFATAFHPELTNDDRCHRHFIAMVEATFT